MLVFTKEPVVRKSGSAAWEILVPLRCQNLSGAVEVVLHQNSLNAKNNGFNHLSNETQPGEIRELTGCTSPTTTVTLHLDHVAGKKSASQLNEVYVVDAWGSVLAKADLPKMRR